MILIHHCLKNVIIASSWVATFLQWWIYKLLELFSFSFIFIMLSNNYNIHTCIHRIGINLIFIPICLVDRYVLFLTSNIPKRGRYINAISVPVSFVTFVSLYLKIECSSAEINICCTYCDRTCGFFSRSPIKLRLSSPISRLKVAL